MAVAILLAEPMKSTVAPAVKCSEPLRESVVWEESKMAEDVNLQSSGYDEDLCENPFFKYLQTKQKQLYDEAANNRWTVGLTCCYSLALVLSKNCQLDPGRIQLP